MPSAAPSRANDYQFAPAPAPAQLSRAVWSSVMADVAARLKILEDVDNGIAQIQAELQQFGLLRLDEAILPLIQQTQANIAILQQKVAYTIAQNDALIEDFQEQIDTAIATLTASIVALQAQVDLILGGGVPAANVAESTTRVFVTPAQKTEIGQLRTDLTALSMALGAITYGSLSPIVYSTASIAPAVAFRTYRMRTATGALTIQLPAAPASGDWIEAARLGANTLTILRNGKTIYGLASDWVLDKDGQGVRLEYYDNDWHPVPWRTA